MYTEKGYQEQKHKMINELKLYKKEENIEVGLSLYSDCKDDHVFIQLAWMNLFIGVKPCPLNQLVWMAIPNHKINSSYWQIKEGIYQNCHKCDWRGIDERTINFTEVAQIWQKSWNVTTKEWQPHNHCRNEECFVYAVVYSIYGMQNLILLVA